MMIELRCFWESSDWRFGSRAACLHRKELEG